MMVMVDRLDDIAVRDLTRRTDPLGVVSVYVNADPRQDPNLRAAAIDLKNRFTELQRRLSEDGYGDRTRDVVAKLDKLWPQVEMLTSPVASARGRMAFAGLDGDWMMQFESAMPVPNRLVLNDGPFIHPLLELLDEGSPAGVVIVTAEEARLLEWRLGSVTTVDQLESEYVEAPHERAGQIGGGPPGQFHTPMREQRQSRERQRAQRFLESVSARAVELAEKFGWERILVSGGERWTEAMIAKLPQALRHRIIADHRLLMGLDDAALADAVTERLREDNRERKNRLLVQILDAAGRGMAALGLSEVAAALNDGRVAHLVYDPQVRYKGSVAADDTPYAEDEVAPGGQQTKPEPRLTERLVERALDTGALVTPIQGAAAGALADAAGIAALLRW
jgi:peptide subunit release factor 1 (eRF1)